MNPFLTCFLNHQRSDTIDSILNSVKKQLGIAPDYESFDPDIVIHINTVFSILHQLGAGPEDGFSISDDSAVWSDYIGDSPKRLNLIKSYMYLKVRLLFDPPTNSGVTEATNRMIGELEFRINAATDFRKE